MSSSDPGRRFVAIALAAAGGLTLAAFAATALLDPFGMAAVAGPLNGPCAAGIKVMDEVVVRPALPAVHQPSDILVGSSRTVRGFDEGAAAMLGGGAVNLGQTGGTIETIDLMTRRAIDAAPVSRVWIGLDFGGAALPGAEPPQPTARIASARMTALQTGLLSPQALKATLAMATRPSACGRPDFDPRGFARAAPPGAFHPIDRATRDRLLHTWRMPAAQREALYRRRHERLRRLLAHLKARDIAAVLYRTPSHPAYDALVQDAGLTPLYRRWRTDVAALAAEAGVVLIEADDPAFLATVEGLPSCGGPAPDCAFIDAVHFRPQVGAAILREGLSRRPPPSPTGAPAGSSPGS